MFEGRGEKWTITSDMVIGIKEWTVLGDGVPSRVDQSISLTKSEFFCHFA